MEIRHLTADDAALYQEIRLEALRNHRHSFYRTLEEEQDRPLSRVAQMLTERNHPNNFILGAFEHDELVGIVGFHQNEPVNLQHRGYIYGLYVRPHLDVNGISRRLVQKLIEKVLLVHNLEQINATSLSASECELYESFSMQKYATIPQALKVGEKYIDEYLYVVHTSQIASATS